MRGWLLAGGLTLLAGFGARAQAPDIQGVWLTEDRQAAVEIFACGQQRCGRIVWAQPPQGAQLPLRDERNPNAALRTRPICRLQILAGLSLQSDGRWGGGNVYDPEEGKTYSAIVARDGADLRVTGYIGTPLLGETQRWTRAPSGQQTCR